MKSVLYAVVACVGLAFVMPVSSIAAPTAKTEKAAKKAPKKELKKGDETTPPAAGEGDAPAGGKETKKAPKGKKAPK